VRIGIALTDARRTLASPYENYLRRDPRADAARFRRLAAEEGASSMSAAQSTGTCWSSAKSESRSGTPTVRSAIIEGKAIG